MTSRSKSTVRISPVLASLTKNLLSLQDVGAHDCLRYPFLRRQYVLLVRVQVNCYAGSFADPLMLQPAICWFTVF
jgi:hypothetical protein